MDQDEVKVNKNNNNKFAPGKYKSKQLYSQKITYLVEKVGLLKLVKLWKLLLISLRVLMTMHDKNTSTQYCFQLFEYYISYFLVVFSSLSL